MAGQGSAPASGARQARHGATLFARARAYAPLTPGERALLRLIEGLACAALVAALPVVADALGRGPVRWDDVARAALAAAAVAVLLALAKYARAQGDPALGTVLAEVAGALDGARTPHATGNTGATPVAERDADSTTADSSPA
jgi:hypothetical protein